MSFPRTVYACDLCRQAITRLRARRLSLPGERSPHTRRQPPPHTTPSTDPCTGGEHSTADRTQNRHWRRWHQILSGCLEVDTGPGNPSNIAGDGPQTDTGPGNLSNVIGDGPRSRPSQVSSHAHHAPGTPENDLRPRGRQLNLVEPHRRELALGPHRRGLAGAVRSSHPARTRSPDRPFLAPAEPRTSWETLSHRPIAVDFRSFFLFRSLLLILEHTFVGTISTIIVDLICTVFFSFVVACFRCKFLHPPDSPLLS